MFGRIDNVVSFVEISDKGVYEVEGKYASMRLKFLLNFKEEMLENLLKDEMLETHLITIQLQSENRYNELVSFNNVKNDNEKVLEQFKILAENQVEEELIFV